MECFFQNGAYFKKYHGKSLPENIDQIGGFEDLKYVYYDLNFCLL